MIQLAQDMYKLLQDRFRNTLRMVVGLAESVGAPSIVTSLLQGLDRSQERESPDYWSEPSRSSAEVTYDSAAVERAAPEMAPHASEDVLSAEKRPIGNKKRGLETPVDLSDSVRPLKVDDVIDGSTYLARIIWTLGVAKLEGIGPLRPADMARMIMSRSPVSLEPPNVARYIRRSKPSCIIVDHMEGSSSFYALSAEGDALFDEKFRLKK
jgi:hypothetical protein